MRAAERLIFAGLLTVVMSVVGQASAATPAGTSVQCSWQAEAQGVAYRYEGTMLGSVKCSRPFGHGRYHSRYEAKITLPTVSEAGSSKLSFKTGTVRGNYQISGTWSGLTHYPGKFHIMGGTGQFRHLAGTLRISCIVHVPFEACNASGTVTGI
jgi:hypothetical protein